MSPKALITVRLTTAQAEFLADLVARTGLTYSRALRYVVNLGIHAEKAKKGEKT